MAIINGNDAANTLTGTTSADTINGLGGNDILQGNAGNDILDGGTGNDRLFGGRGNDVYRYGRGYGNDVIDNSGGAASDVDLIQLTNLTSSQIRLTRVGFDLVLSVLATGETLTVSQCFLDADHALEGIVFADGTRWGVSEALANLYYVPVTPTAGADIINGDPTDDTLFGLGGNDQLYGNYGNDTLDGGSGNDLMVGGQGNDTYVVDAAGDVVVEAAGGGDDLVCASISYTLGNNVERLTLTGSANLNGTGNGLDNTLIGNTGNNRLDGGAGNDVLFGGEGNDVLMGGAGNDRLDGGTGSDQLAGRQGSDTYVYAQGYGNDLIDNSGGAASDVDTLQLVGLNSNQVRFARVGNDLQMRILATAETLTVSGFYLRADNEIDRVRFDNGITWNTATLKAAAAQPNAAPTSTNDSQTTLEDTALTLGVGDFGSYTDPENNPLVSVMITRLPSAGSLLYLSGSNWVSAVQNQVISKVDLDAGKLQFVPAANANGAGYASIGFKVGDGVAYSVAAYTLNIDVTAVPDVPTAVATVTTLSNDSGVAGDFITNVEFQTISGTFTGSLNAGERIEVTADGGNTWVNASVFPDAHAWAALIDLIDGENRLDVRVIDMAGSILAGVGHDYNLDTSADTEQIANVTFPDLNIDGAEKAAVSYVLSGVDADATAVVTFRDGASHEAVGQNGVVDLSGFQLGAVGVTLSIEDIAGNSLSRGIGGGGTVTAINFDSLPSEVPVTNQYQAQGVVINGASAINASLLGLSSHSGTQVAYSPQGLMTFDLSIADIKTVSAYLTGPVDVGLYAYDSSNNLIGQALLPANAPANTLLSVTSSGAAISKVLVHDGGAAFTIDDISFKVGNQLTLVASPTNPITGDSNDNILVSTSATDVFTGGAGNDTFQFAQLPGSTPDQITDFTPGSDVVALNSAVFDLHGKTLADAFASGNAQTEAEGAHLTFNQEDHTLYYDSDGMANNNSVAVVTLAGVNSLAAGDLAMIA